MEWELKKNFSVQSTNIRHKIRLLFKRYSYLMALISLFLDFEVTWVAGNRARKFFSLIGLFEFDPFTQVLRCYWSEIMTHSVLRGQQRVAHTYYAEV